MGRRLPEHHRKVRGPQRGVGTQRLLDRPRDLAELRLGIEGRARLDACGHDAWRQLLVDRTRDERVEALRGPARTLAPLSVERDRHLGTARERGHEGKFARVEELEGVDKHEPRQVPAVLDRLSGERRRLARVEPLAVLEETPVRGVHRGQRCVVGAARAPRGLHDGRGLDARADEFSDGPREECMQARRVGDRREARCPTRLDLGTRGALQQLHRHIRGRDGAAVRNAPGEEVERCHLEVERDAAALDDAPPELVAVAGRRHEHERRGESVRLDAPGRERDEALGLPRPWRPADDGQPAHAP